MIVYECESITQARHRTIEVDDIEIVYREAGADGRPVVLLLHGFPSSSHRFRLLLLSLADGYHVFAPDFPGFGFSAHPDRARYAYTFEHYTETTEAFGQA
jgi:pimeloyl-ACP methyl ester carboxylesterase